MQEVNIWFFSEIFTFPAKNPSFWKRRFIYVDYIHIIWISGPNCKFEFFLCGGSEFKTFWNLTFPIYFYYQNGYCGEIWVKTKQISWFYNVFGLGVWPEWFYSSCNAPSQSSHKRWTQPPRSMKFCKDVPYMYILKVKKFWVCACLRLDSIEENIEGDATCIPPE